MAVSERSARKGWAPSATAALGAVSLATAPLSAWLSTGWAWTLSKTLLGLALLLMSWILRRRNRNPPPSTLGRPGYKPFAPRLKYLLQGTAAVTAWALAATALNVAAHLWGEELDLSQQRVHTLSPQTLAVLKRQKKQVHMIGLYSRDDPARRKTQELLKRYASASEHIQVSLVDPARRPDLQALSNRRRSHVLLSNEDRIVFVPESRQPPSEQSVTRALLRLTTSERPVVYWLLGHGEPDPSDTQAQGASLASKELEIEGYQVHPLRLWEAQAREGALQEPPRQVPDDARAVVWVGGRSPLLPTEVQALLQYVRAGGRLLLGAEPGIELGAAEVNELFGLELGDDWVVDPGSGGIGVSIVAQPSPGPHPLSASLSRAVALESARSIRPKRIRGPRIQIELLLQTRDEAWGETRWRDATPQRDGADHLGPVTVAAAVSVPTQETNIQTPVPEARAVVVGSGAWLTNGSLGHLGNRDLLLRSVAWLTQTAPTLSIPPKARRGGGAILTNAELARLRLWTLDVLPLLLMATGAVVVTRRRARRGC